METAKKRSDAEEVDDIDAEDFDDQDTDEVSMFKYTNR